MVGPDDAEDCFQETFIAALRAYDRMDGAPPAGLGDDDRAPQGDRPPPGPGAAAGAARASCPSAVATDATAAGLRRPRRGGLDGGRRAAVTRSGRRSRCATPATSPIARSPRRSSAARTPPGAGSPTASSACARSIDEQEVADEPRRHDDRASPSAAAGADELGARRRPRAWSSAPDAEGLVDVAYASFDSPLGTASDRGHRARASSRVGLPNLREERVPRASSQRRLAAGARAAAPARRAPAASSISTSRGRRREFELELDWRLVRSEFSSRVLHETPRSCRSARRRATARSPPGPATRAPTAPPARALGPNPIPIVVPCHRVLRTGGVARRLRRRAGDEAPGCCELEGAIGS